MEVLEIYPKDICVKLEFRLSQLVYILDFLGKCKVEYDGQEEPEIKSAATYVEKELFPKIFALVEDVKNNKGAR